SKGFSSIDSRSISSACPRNEYLSSEVLRSAGAVVGGSAARCTLHGTVTVSEGPKSGSHAVQTSIQSSPCCVTMFIRVPMVTWSARSSLNERHFASISLRPRYFFPLLLQESNRSRPLVLPLVAL